MKLLAGGFDVDYGIKKKKKKDHEKSPRFFYHIGVLKNNMSFLCCSVDMCISDGRVVYKKLGEIFLILALKLCYRHN